MGDIKVQKQCRICHSSGLEEFLDLGETSLANAFLKHEDLKKPEQKYPLRVQFCQTCGLSQLKEVVSPDILFRNYIYFSSGMPVLPEHFKNYAEEVVTNFARSKNDLVVEIGSNDGLLLGAIQQLGMRVLGIDPAINIAQVANERGVETLAQFFSYKLTKNISKLYGKAKVIIGNNVVAHIDDHHDLVTGVKTLLGKDGVFIFEAPYIVDMFENLTFDTVYHEHLSYLSIRPLVKLFAQYDMEVFNAKIFPVQGQSIRVYVAHKGKFQPQEAVRKLLAKEKQMKMDLVDSYHQLAMRIIGLKGKVRNILYSLKEQGKTIAAYGAPAKGNTLLAYFGIGTDVLDYATEGLPSKIGMYTPGTHIPIIDINEARKNPPDYYLMLAWNYKDAILEKEQEFKSRGGKFIIPVNSAGII